jgi:hypothetical protein
MDTAPGHLLTNLKVGGIMKKFHFQVIFLLIFAPLLLIGQEKADKPRHLS